MSDSPTTTAVKASVQDLRKVVLPQLNDLLRSEQVYKKDVLKLESNDAYANAFLVHNHHNLESASSHVLNCLQKRKVEGILEIKESEFPRQMVENDALYLHGRSKKDCQIMFLRVREHNTQPASVLAEILKTHGQPFNVILKRYFLFLLEKQFCQENGAPIVVLYNLSGAGLRNWDMDFIKFVLSCFQVIFPNFLDLLLLYEMPWVLQTCWKVIQGLLSEDARSKIGFASKKSILDFISVDQLPAEVGGTSVYVYTPPVEVDNDGDDRSSQSDTPSIRSRGELPKLPTEGGGGDASNLRTSKFSSFRSTMQIERSRKSYRYQGKLVAIEPDDCVLFYILNAESKLRLVEGKVEICNVSMLNLVFKMRTTTPDKYRITPSQGLLNVNSCTEIVIHYRLGNEGHPEEWTESEANMMFDRIQILVHPIADPNHTLAKALDLLKQADRNQLFEYRLKCKIIKLPNLSKTQEDDDSSAKEDKLLAMTQTMQKTMSQELRQIRLLLYCVVVGLMGLCCLVLIVF